MSNDRYQFHKTLPEEAAIMYQDDSTLSYSFSSQGKHGGKSVSISLLYLALSKYGTDWISMTHSHTFTELFYITHGNGKFSVGSEIVQVKANDLIIINPGLEHTERSDDSRPMEYIVFGFDGVMFQSGQSDYIHLNSTVQKADLHLYFNALAHELKREAIYKNFVCQNLLNIIFTVILRSNDLKLSIFSNLDCSKECKMAARYIDNHFQETITLDSLSSLVHLNKYYFSHIFTEEMGISPINYLIKKRIDECKHLLTNTDHSLASISQIVGFSSPSYFSQAFRKITGFTPQEFRKQNRSLISVSHLPGN